jgi:hypothetical protein
VWETIKGFGIILKDYVIDRIKGIVSGIGAIGSAIYKLFSGDFSGAWQTAKQGLADMSGYNAVKNVVAAATEMGKTTAAQVSAGAAVSQVKKPGTGQTPAVTPARSKAKATTDAIASGGTRNTSVVINLRNMVEKMVFDSSLAQSRGDLEKQVGEIMNRILAMAQSTA